MRSFIINTIGSTGWLSLVMIWWVAWANDWNPSLTFDTLNEQWLEGILFHVFAAVMLASTVLQLREQRRKLRGR